MSRIEMIKELQAKGLGPVAISERLRINRKTVSRYMAMEDFEESRPEQKMDRFSKLDSFKPLIREGWKKIAKTAISSAIRPCGFIRGSWKNALTTMRPIRWYNGT